MSVPATDETQYAPSPEAIRGWLITHLATVFGIAEQQVDPALPFDDYGLESRAAASMIGQLGEWLGRDLNPSLVYDHPSVDHLVTFLTLPQESSR